MCQGHLHQLQLWALLHGLLTAHGPADKATAVLAADEKAVDTALPTNLACVFNAEQKNTSICHINIIVCEARPVAF
jgi:hypothetical protein